MTFSKLFFPVRRKFMVWAANLIARKARKNARWSSTIPGAIGVSTVQDKGNVSTVEISVDMEKAPSALAFELGSGLYGEKKQKYKIRPKDAQALAFVWEGGPSAAELFKRSRKFIGRTSDGRLMFTEVDHPGVKPKPYMEPAVDEVKDSIVGRLADITVKVAADSIGQRVEVIR